MSLGIYYKHMQAFFTFSLRGRVNALVHWHIGTNNNHINSNNSDLNILRLAKDTTAW